MRILVVNAGSSSLKLSLFAAPDLYSDQCDLIWSAHIDGRGTGARLSVEIAGEHHEGSIDATDNKAIRKLIESIWTAGSSDAGHRPVCAGPDEINIVGHRIVHGGSKYTGSSKINEAVLEDLRRYIELAPEHESANINAVELAMEVLPQATHVAVFDTAYHSQMPLASKIYAGPYDWYEKGGIYRFGFHGISHRYCVERASQLVPQRPIRRVITCHLGSGGSLCASLEGKSMMTTMGYTPLEGLVMRTRSGTIDPGLILHLLRNKTYTVEELSEVLNRQSGLQGISGLSGDMREIEKEASCGNERAQLAFDIYEQSLSSAICSLMPILGGLDALVFTGGIGENSSLVRSATCQKLSFLGIALDAQKNTHGAGDRNISSACASVQTLVVAAREDLAISKECLAFRIPLANALDHAR